MASEIASIFAKIGADTSGLERGLTRARGSVDGFTSALHKIGGALAAAFTVREIARFTSQVINLASDMNETITKTNVVFGEQSAALIEWAESAAISMGMSQNEAMAAAATYGNFFRSMGMASDVSAVMSKNLVALAGDLASFNNIDPTEALDKLRAGLAGEVEPLRRLGVNLTAASIEAKAMAMGIMRAGDEITAATRAQAAYALILEQTATAQGDFARTSDGLANQQRILKATWKDLKTTIGEAFLPLATTLTTMLSAAADSIGPSLENISQQIRNWSIGLLADMFHWGANMVQSLANGIAGSSAVVNALNQIGSYFTMMLQAHSPPKLLPDLEKWGANAAQSYFDGWTGTTPTSKGILDNWQNVLKPILEGVDAGTPYTEEMGKRLRDKMGGTGAVLAEYASSYSDLQAAVKETGEAQKNYDEIAKEGDEDAVKGAKERLDKAKDGESAARARFATAQSRVRQEAASQAALIDATRKQTEAIKQQGQAISDQTAAQAAAAQKAIDTARLAWQMAQTDTAGRIKLLDEESKKYEEGSVDWYHLQTQKINLEKQLQAEQTKSAAAAAGAPKSIMADLEQIEGLGDLLGGMKKDLVDIGNGLFIDPLTMQIESPPPNLFNMIKNLGKAMGGDFIKKFIEVMWSKLKEALGMDPDATIGESLVTFGTKVGDAVGAAIWDSISRILREKMDSWMAGLAPDDAKSGVDPSPRGGRNPFPDIPAPAPGWSTAPEVGTRSGNNITINTSDARGVVLELRKAGAI